MKLALLFSMILMYFCLKRLVATLDPTSMEDSNDENEILNLRYLEATLIDFTNAINFSDRETAGWRVIKFLLSLPEAGGFLINNGTWVIERINDPFMRAVLANNIAITPGVSHEEKEFFWRLALQQNSFPPEVAKNYAYFLEQATRDQEALHVLRETMKVSNDWTLRLMEACICPPHFQSKEETETRYMRLLTQLTQLLMEGPPSEDKVPEDPINAAAGSLPLSWAYLGYGMRILHELLALGYSFGFPSLRAVAFHLLEPLPDHSISVDNEARHGSSSSFIIRLGVVAEQSGNRSPRKLLQPLLSRLSREIFYIIFFQPPGLDELYDFEMRERADEVVDLYPRNIKTWQLLVADQHLDFLLYEALGTGDAGPWLLAHSRLAKVQAGYGHGHPITSGLDSIDYFLSSMLFETDPYSASQKSYTHYSNAKVFIGHISGNSNHSTELDVKYSGDGVQDYTEQYVMFDSLTTYFIEPEIPASAQTRNQFGLDFKNYQIYACLQHSKKLHPEFDDYLSAVLKRNPKARVLLLQGAKKAHEKRWKHTLGASLIGQLIYLPLMSHEDYLSIIKQSHAVLDSFPWGMGVTAFEAFAACAPVISAPAMTSVLQLTLGQLRTMGIFDTIAKSPEEYADIAYKLGNNRTFSNEIRSKICSQKHLIFQDEQSVHELEHFIILSLHLHSS